MMDHSFRRTGLQDHFHGFLSAREGGCVDGEMAELVLLAQRCSVLKL